MKERILGNLQLFSELDDLGANSMARELCEELSMSIDELRERSKNVLKIVLHNYSLFEVSTIDRVTHNIIRTFARDLKISQGFEVTLETDLLLEEAVSRILGRAGIDEGLTEFLMDFSLEKIEDDKSWNIFKDLFDMGKLLFEEVHAHHLKKLKNKSLDDFRQLQQKLKTDIGTKEQQIQKAADKALDIIASNNLVFSDFIGGYFPKFMQTLQEGNFNVNFNATWKQDFREKPLYNKSAPQGIKDVLDTLHEAFAEIFDQIKHRFWERSFLKNCYKNLVPMSVLNEISKEVKSIQAERDILPISDFNTIIAETIKDEPVPFIYERLGEKFRHYFIDEFQDTSAMQWQNLIPLIANALEGANEEQQKGSLTLLGDVKQSIYRWRGGEAEQFLRLINGEEAPFVVKPSINDLVSNWRSHDEIIAFNNSFFAHASKFLINGSYRQLYEGATQQQSRSKKGGFVEISFLEKKEDLDPYCVKTLEIIGQVTDKGHGYGDICILVRDNKKAAQMATFLTAQNVPLVSPDSLLLKNNREVRFLLALLQWLEDPKDKESCYDILVFLFSQKKELHDCLVPHLSSLETYLAETYGFDRKALSSKSTYDILELAIAKFGLHGPSDGYLFSLLDEAFMVQGKQGPQITSFLEHWRLKENSLSLTSPSGVDAVQIMTIHKAKGLEFEIVIFPYADAKLIDSKPKKLWVPVEAEKFLGFDRLLLSSNKMMAYFGETVANIYQEEQEKTQLDAYNVLYVAMTRAVKALYILSSAEVSSQTETYSGLFKNFLDEKGLWQDNQLTYTFGNLTGQTEKHSPKDQENVPLMPTAIENSTLKRALSHMALASPERKKALAKGNLLHNAMSQIRYRNEIPETIKRIQSQSDLSEEDVEFLQQKIDEIVNHEELRAFFMDNLEVFNEQDVIGPDNQLLRPDRIVIKEGVASVIDYKTGNPSKSHQDQLRAYAQILADMGLTIENKVLIYINDSITPIFV